MPFDPEPNVPCGGTLLIAGTVATFDGAAAIYFRMAISGNDAGGRDLQGA
jgi:hypothetical protein